jgi:RNA polymerase sigma factor (sigma-70 family)
MEGAVSETEARSRFLEQFDPDPRKAERKYLLLRSKLIFYFRQNGAADPENLADEVFFRALRRISEGAETYAGINAYCYGVADFVLREQRRRPRPEQLPDEPAIKQPSARNSLRGPEQQILIRECFGQMTESERLLFQRYHLDDRDELARDMNVTPNGLRVRICRIRQKLREKISQAGKRISAEA